MHSSDFFKCKNIIIMIEYVLLVACPDAVSCCKTILPNLDLDRCRQKLYLSLIKDHFKSKLSLHIDTLDAFSSQQKQIVNTFFLHS